MKQPKIVLLIFVSGKIVLTGAKVKEFCFILFFKILCSYTCFLTVCFFRWEMRHMRPLKIYIRYLQNSGKASSGMNLSCVFGSLFPCMLFRNIPFVKMFLMMLQIVTCTRYHLMNIMCQSSLPLAYLWNCVQWSFKALPTSIMDSTGFDSCFYYYDVSGASNCLWTCSIFIQAICAILYMKGDMSTVEPYIEFSSKFPAELENFCRWSLNHIF